MPTPGRRTPRRYPDAVRRRLDVATARAWEALVNAHTRQALRFITLFAGKIPFDEALLRYLREMDVPGPMATAVQTRVLAALEGSEHRALLEASYAASEPARRDGAGGSERWRRFRPDLVVRGVRERSRRNEVTERWVQLAIAQAEEGVIKTHIDNAMSFVAVVDPYLPISRSVEEYIDALGLAGGRAQAVYQRAMARLAEIHLPTLESEAASARFPLVT